MDRRAGSPRMARLLVVEDDQDLREVLAEVLGAAGYDVMTAGTGDEALDLACGSPPALVLLDLILSGIDGFTVCRELRQRSEVPIIVMSGRASERDRVRALDLGADAYLTKPVGAAELVAQVRAALRRPHLAPPGEAERLRVGQLEIDPGSYRVRVDGRAVRLTPTEFALLVELARRPGRVVPRRELLRRVWGAPYGEESDYLYVYVHRLRQKLAAGFDGPAYLSTEPGVGYALCVRGEPAADD